MEKWQEEFFLESVAASNRTTHAVRAIVRFLFIQLAASTVAVAFIVLGSLSQSGGFSLIGFLLLFAGIVWASIAGWSELEKSRVPVNTYESSPGSGRDSELMRKINLLSDVELELWDKHGSPNLYYWNDSLESFTDWISHYKAD